MRMRRKHIVDVLNDLLDKAQTQLDDTRHSAHNFAMLVKLLRTSWHRTRRLWRMRKVKAEFTMALEAEKADFIEAQKIWGHLRL